MTSWRNHLDIEFRRFSEVGSTNDIARQWAESSDASCGVVWSEKQTAGRGRRGNSWVCPRGEGIAATYWLRPTFPRTSWPQISLVAALALCEVLESEWSLHASIKWPNDVWIRGKKLAGVLVEVAGDDVIVGIGMNVNNQDFPDLIRDSATSILLELGQTIDRKFLLEALVSHLHQYLLQMDGNWSDLLQRVRGRCPLSGRHVRLTSQGVMREVEVMGIGDRGELWVLSDGQPEALWQADEVRPLL